MKCLIIIPSRMQSSRLPRKPLADIHGQSMLQRVWNLTQSINHAAQVIIATDSKEIAQHAHTWNGNVCVTSDQLASGTDRCAAVLQMIDDGKLPLDAPDIIINVQGDEPMLPPTYIDQLIDLMKSHPDVPIGTLVSPFNDEKEVEKPQFVKCVFTHEGRALYFSRATIPFVREQNEVSYHKHIGLYGFKADFLRKLDTLPISSLEDAEKLEQLRWLQAGYAIQVGQVPQAVYGVDTPEDLEYVRSIWRSA